MGRKLTVKYIGGAVAGFDQRWGGTQATNYALLKAMENHPEFTLVAKFRADFPNDGAIVDFLADADLTHVDDTAIITRMFKAKLAPPDIIGPITRSPLKNYQGWKAEYPTVWFYKARVIRLNYAEEGKSRHLVTLIRHGVDTEMLKPVASTPRKFVLWAGNSLRDAKNFPLMREIVLSTSLPPGFEFKVLTDYFVADYWAILDETAILVNTSKYESFCCAAFEAMAKGVPVIWRQGLQGGVHEAAGCRVDYDAGSYRRAILEALEDRNYIEMAAWARRYCENEASLEVMARDLTAVYRDVAKEKQRAA